MVNKWVFDKNVAKNFDYIADTSIPKYRVIIHKTINILRNLSRDSKIIDVGCATGNTLDVLKKQGFTNIWGVDNSRAMLQETMDKGHQTHYSSDFPVQLSPFDVVIANWTLHFIKPHDRYNYIESIYNSLNNHGIFILSEKVSGDQTEYLDFKRSNFLSEEEIKEKSEALKDVLITRPKEWYLNILTDLGFRIIKIIDETYCFATFLLVK